MNYNKVLSVAGTNKQSASAAQIKRYSTEIPASKKPPKTKVQSEAVKAFLARKQKEEEMKARQAERKKQDLLELRSIARNGKRANAMATRTKDNNFMRNFAKTAELADTSRDSNVRSGPQWCSVRPRDRDLDDRDRKNRDSESPDAKRKRPIAAANPSVNFYDLLKVAAKKQHEPLALPRIPKKKDAALEEQGRMMTTEEKRRFIEEQARKQGKSLTEVVVPKRTRKRYVPGQEINSYEVAVKPGPLETNRKPGMISKMQRIQSGGAKLSPIRAGTGARIVSKSRMANNDQRTAPSKQKSVALDDKRKGNGQRPSVSSQPPPPQERRKYYPDVMPKKQKLENDNYDNRLKVIRNGSSVSKSAPEKQLVAPERNLKAKERVAMHPGKKRTALLPPPQRTQQSQAAPRRSVTKPVPRSVLPSPSTSKDHAQQVKQRSQNPQSRQTLSLVPQTRRIPPKEPEIRQFPPRDLMPRQFPPRDLMPRQFPPRDVVRRPMQKPMMPRIESDEDEYDEEMDDFIDDGPVDSENLNYSQHIKEIFGYDRSKYRYVDDDDLCMESSYLQQMKEEAISAKLGILEDLEDIQREEQDLRLKAIRKRKK